MNEHTRRYLLRLRDALGDERVAFILRSGRCTDSSEQARAHDLLRRAQLIREVIRPDPSAARPAGGAA